MQTARAPPRLALAHAVVPEAVPRRPVCRRAPRRVARGNGVGRGTAHGGRACRGARMEPLALDARGEEAPAFARTFGPRDHEDTGREIAFEIDAMRIERVIDLGERAGISQV